MGFIAEAKRKNLWFGTEEKMEWFKTPSRGADTSPAGWDSEGTTLNGGGYVFNSFGSHKQYQFDWGSSNARVVAQKMKSYADGSYGRGYIYFVDPTIYDHNVLPAHWADPSMGIDYEGNSIIAGVDPVGVPTGANSNDLPVQAAQFNLNTIPVGFRGKAQAVYVPIPEGHTLSLGAMYSFTGSGGVFASPVLLTGAIAAPQKLTTLGVNTPNIVADTFSGVRGVWLWVGKTATGNSTITIHGLIGRLMTNAEATSHTTAENHFTNPNLVGDGTWAEVRRNLMPINPSMRNSLAGWVEQADVTHTATPDGLQVDVVSALANNAIMVRTSNENGTEVVSGVGAYTGAFRVHVPEGFPAVTVWTTIYWNSTGTGATYPVMIQPGETKKVQSSAGEVPNGDVARVWLRAGAAIPAGARLVVSEAQLESATGDLGPYFDGSTTPETAVGVDQPEDFRWRWLGAPNASESVMEIERVREMLVTNAIAGVSTFEGKPAVRVIITANGGFAYFSTPTILRPNPSTILGTLNLKEPHGAIAASYARTLLARAPDTATPQTPGEPGSYPLKLSLPPMPTLFQVRLNNGGVYGASTDVWWTDIGLFAGDYDGPAFSGSSPQNGTTHYRWTGAIDNSTSEAYYVSSKSVEQKRGPWVGGMGHSGCRFVGKPTFIENGPDWTGLSATFKEVVN